MDVSVLPNNNHPHRFLQLDVGALPAGRGQFQLDVGALPAGRGQFQLGAVKSSQRSWQNRLCLHLVSDDRPGLPLQDGPVTVDRYLEKHISPNTLNIKSNPLYQDTKTSVHLEDDKFNPSWTVNEYDTQTIHGHLSDHIKEDENSPKDLDFWLENLYTPGFDSLLKKEKAEKNRKKLCKVLSSVLVSVCAVLLIVLPIVVLHKTK